MQSYIHNKTSLTDAPVLPCMNLKDASRPTGHILGLGKLQVPRRRDGASIPQSGGAREIANYAQSVLFPKKTRKTTTDSPSEVPPSDRTVY